VLMQVFDTGHSSKRSEWAKTFARIPVRIARPQQNPHIQRNDLKGTAAGIGWNMNYPFNTGDLLCCSQCAANYLDANAKVPWDDLRYAQGPCLLFHGPSNIPLSTYGCLHPQICCIAS